MALTPNREQRFYVPLLKGKQGEFRAILNLSSARNHIIPLFEHEPCAITDTTDLKRELESKYIHRFVKTNWTGRAFVDLYHLRKAPLAGTLHPLQLVLSRLSEGHIEPTPVVGPNYPDDFVDAVKKLAPKYGVCIRLRVGRIDLFELVTKVDELIATLEIEASQADLLLDFGPITSEQESAIAFTAVSLILQLQSKPWRTFTLAAGAFPQNLEQVKGGTHGRIRRCDWTMWQKVMTRLSVGEGHQSPIMFSDYGVNHPNFPPSNAFMTIVPSLRYTLLEEPEWLVLKEAKSDLGNRGFFDLCRRLIRMPEYAGRDHCWADEEIYDRAQGRGGPGNATSWREYGTVHHITTVVDQIASFRVP
jgi:hypothetical protein